MKIHPTDHDRADVDLTAMLRKGDPAADGAEPTAGEVADLRRAVLNAIPPRRSLRWLPLAAATGALALAALLITPAGPDRSGPVRDSAPKATENGAPTAETTVETPSTHRQQLQFATENGTRIIWVLDPDLTL